MTDQNPLQQWLASLTGSLLTTTPEEAAGKEELIRHLTVSLPSTLKLTEAKLPSFAFENIHPSTVASLHPGVQHQLSAAAREESIDVTSNEFRVFVRESPIRDIQAGRSVPSWAGGAEVAKTIGPFIDIDGRRRWFDFFRVEKLVALYVQGVANPVLLFNINVSTFWSDQYTSLLAPAQKHYNLTANSSIWINSELLAADAPAGKYTGLTITSGTIDINEDPVVTGDKTTITPAAHVVVKLKLRQQQVTDADPASPYGTDARAADYTLPGILEFEFSSAGSKITAAGNAQSFMFGQPLSYQWKNEPAKYSSDIFQIAVPYTASATELSVSTSTSPFTQFAGTAPIFGAFWLLPVADLDITHISPAAGIGGIGVICNKGLTAQWSGLQHAPVALNMCIVAGYPGTIAIASNIAGNSYARQKFTLWQDEQNPHPSTVSIEFGKQFAFKFFSTANGYELLEATVNATVEADRPVDVSAHPLSIHSKGSFFALIAHSKHRTIMLYDNNIVQDNFNPEQLQQTGELKMLSLAMQNALFTTSEVNGCFLAGELGADWKKVQHGTLYTALAVYKYIPSLPDPYAANVGIFQRFNDYRLTDRFSIHIPIMLLLCQVKWGIRQHNEPDNVDVHFHLLPFNVQNAQQQQSLSLMGISSPANDEAASSSPLLWRGAGGEAATTRNDWTTLLDNYFRDEFALVDVSSHANQLGISFGLLQGGRGVGRKEASSSSLAAQFGVKDEGDQLQSLYRLPFKVDNVQVMSPSLFTRSFLLPQIAWEPVYNTAPQVKIGTSAEEGDPPHGMNFYPNDGGATRLSNNSFDYVPLAPKPVIKDIIRRFKEDKENVTWSYFTLPFGLKAIAVMSKEESHKQSLRPPSINLNRPVFNNDLRGGIQIQCDGGELPADYYPMFNGGTVQQANVLDGGGSPSLSGTLGASVGFIFNGEFAPSSPLLKSRGVPLTRIDFSGYGASVFNNWFNPNAQVAQTSQTLFDVFVGRTAHEVIQVKSIVYPWGIRVVRTIVLYRTNTGYIYRVDTGWQAESDGVFNFNLKFEDPPKSKNYHWQDPHYKIHPGIVKGLFNIKNIVEVNEQHVNLSSTVRANDYYLTKNNEALKATSSFTQPAVLQKLTFDADVEIEGLIQGQHEVKLADGSKHYRTPSKGVVGYVQLAPMGVVLSTDALTDLITKAGGAIGGPVNCVIDINGSNQKMRLSSIDVSDEQTSAANETFVAAARGSAILPKDGSWSMVRHTASSGEVAPLPEHTAVPVIRVGQLTINTTNGDNSLSADPTTQLVRVANPTEILRAPASNTVNYGFLQSMGTQKTLFLTPSFKNGVKQLMSKTPPLFADAYRLMGCKAIFPNIGDAVNNFKDAVKLDPSKFVADAIKDAGATVYQLMNVSTTPAVEQAYKLAKNPLDSFAPPSEWKLIDESFLRIVIKYTGKHDLDIDSLASTDQWKSRLNDLAMVVSLGDAFPDLVTIKGNFNSQKGVEASFGGGNSAADGPLQVQMIFSDALEKAKDILQILVALSGGDYEEVMKKGLKIAMSNSAGTWDYKFEASQEIPVIRFPFLDYENPTWPLKLEASLKVGVYFNAALMVTTDAKKLLPTAGAMVEFYGQLRVMCVSLEAATVYAIGQVTLGTGADTGKGMIVHMKFGFGVQLVVGLPVVGNVSVMYVVGVEIMTATSGEVAVSAFLLFKGHAELLGGIVGITIMIEAKGTIDRKPGGNTTCMAQVTFAIDISIFLVINIDFSTSWEESRQIA